MNKTSNEIENNEITLTRILDFSGVYQLGYFLLSGMLMYFKDRVFEEVLVNNSDL